MGILRPLSHFPVVYVQTPFTSMVKNSWALGTCTVFLPFADHLLGTTVRPHINANIDLCMATRKHQLALFYCREGFKDK